MHPLLQIKNLSIAFGDSNSEKAVSIDSLIINRASTVALVGESGSGKSITALSILRLLPGSAYVKGNIIFFEKDRQPVDILKVSEKELNTIRGNKVAMIFQEPMTSLNP